MGYYIFERTNGNLSPDQAKMLVKKTYEDQQGYENNFSYEKYGSPQAVKVTPTGSDELSVSKIEHTASSEFRWKVTVSYIGSSVVTLPTAAAAAAGTVYSIDFENSTPDTWTLSVYQTLPASPGLKSVSWKQTTVPKSGESGVQWNVDYLVGIANYKQVGQKGVYKSSQKLGTALGTRWAARFESGAQQLFQDGTANPGQVIIENQSGELANLAIGMDGDMALVQADVYSGNAAQFEVTPTYWVALFKDVVQGEVISGNQVHGPIKAVFPSGKTSLTYVAYIDGSTFKFGLKGGQMLSAPLEEVELRLHKLEAA